VNAVQLKEYLSVFEKAFLTKTISPFFTNKQLEIIKNPEIFFFDMGLRNVIIKNFSALEDRGDKGAMLENYKPKVGYILNFNQIGEREFNGVGIKFLPHFLDIN
jgi:hypothetical protein